MKTLKWLLAALIPVAGTALAHTYTLNFAAVLGDKPLACGHSYENVGSENTAITVQDARLYVSNVNLLTAAGEKVPLGLEQDGLWQHDDVALLDFEDATGHCQTVGTQETNTQVIGDAPAGDYVGVSFDVGVPFALNHQDATTAPSPLNLSAMFWSWQGGYKFVRVELVRQGAPETGDGADEVAASAGAQGHASGGMGLWPIHIGSTGCASPAPVIAPTDACSRPNVASVRLEPFDATQDTITFDAAGLVDGVDVSKSLELAPPGCMSGFDDPDCLHVFENMGISLEDGQAQEGAQNIFRVGGSGGN